MSRPRLVALLLALVTLVVYLPVTRHGFINYDDDAYVASNQTVQNGLTPGGIQWAFTTFHASNWHPLTWLSHMADCEFFGPNPAAHHFVNVLFHAANAVLLFALLLRLTGALWPAAFVAALFAWHPLHVESVAWVSERKDVLSTFFALLALLSYTKFVKENCRRSFWFTLIFFALGLMSKPMLVTLPFVLLLLDYWPLQRFPNSQIQTIRHLVLEKWPFLLLTVISCVVTFVAQRQGEAIVSLQNVSLPYRLENVPVAYAGYLQKMFWPADLAVIYPMPGKNFRARRHGVGRRFDFDFRRRVGLAQARAVSARRLALVFRDAGAGHRAGAGRRRGAGRPLHLFCRHGNFPRRHPWRLRPGNPVSPSENDSRHQRRRDPGGVPGVDGKSTALLAQQRNAVFTHALAVTQDNDIARVNLGVALEQQGKPEAALAEYRAAARLMPGRYQIHNNLGNCLDHLGRPVEALAEYHEAARLNPKLPEFHNSLGIVLVELGRYDEALVEFTNAAQLNIAYPWAHFEMAKALLKLGRDAEAIDQFREALRLDPENFQILAHTARVLSAEENPQVRDGKTALRLASKANDLTGGTQPLVLDALGMACAENGDFTNATEVTQRALDLATAANMQSLEAIRQRLALYQNHQPWRESFLATNMPPENLPKR